MGHAAGQWAHHLLVTLLLIGFVQIEQSEARHSRTGWEHEPSFTSKSENALNKASCALPPKKEETISKNGVKRFCLAGIASWSFNKTARKCVPWTYGGCGGNANRYDSQSECELTCLGARLTPKPIPTRDKAVCLQPARRQGWKVKDEKTRIKCTEHIPSWSYDRFKRKCIDWIYGGCNGNENRFDSHSECELTCMQSSSPTTRPPVRTQNEICKLPLKRGAWRCPVGKWVFRWYYDAKRGQCFEFTYGGCEGNQNNFEYKQDCEQACSKPIVQHKVG